MKKLATQSIPRYARACLEAVLNPPADVHKYSRGVAQLCAGSPAYPGAALLCARAAQRSGAGYTQLFTDAPCQPLQVAAPSLVVRALATWEMPAHVPCALGIGSGFPPDAFVSLDATNALDTPNALDATAAFDASAASDVSAATSTSPATTAPDAASAPISSDATTAFQATLNALFARVQTYPYCIIIDGGALSFLATEQGKQWADARAQHSLPLIITPHVGEAARLLASISDALPGNSYAHQADEPTGRKHDAQNGTAPANYALEHGAQTAAEPMGVASEQGERDNHTPRSSVFQHGAQPAPTPANHALEHDALRLSQHFSCCVCLKSANTVIADQNSIATLTDGGVELAKAGTGDVLLGIITALCAQQLAPFDAALSGAYLHALAGKFAADQADLVSVIPEDVIAALPQAYAYVRSIHE